MSEEPGLLECQVYRVKSEQAAQLKPRLEFLTPTVTPFFHLNTNSFNSQRQYLLCTKEPGVQKDRLSRGQIPAGFSRLGPAARKISREKEWTSQQKQPADLAESSFIGLGKCCPN